MDKFPKIETIEATLFGDRMDRGTTEGAATLAKNLLVENSECEQLQDAMNPRQLTEGRQKPCDSCSCDSIT